MIIRKRWNLDADSEGIVVCKDTHEKGEPCEGHQERISHKEVLGMLEELQGIAFAIHYPDCWDTFVYPTLLDAIHELWPASGCVTCCEGVS